MYDMNGNMLHYSKNYVDSSPNLESSTYYFPLPNSLIFNLKKSDYVIGNENYVSINKLKFEKDTAVIGSTVPLAFDCVVANKMTLKSAHINFYDENTKAMFSSYLKSLDSDSYFSIPSIVKEGNYKIDSIVFTVDIYEKGIDTVVIKNTIENESYRDIFAQNLFVTKSNNQNVLYFATEDLDEMAYETIKNSQNNSIVVVDADYQTIIPAKLFEMIKDTSRQLIVNYQDNEWIINGVDVESNKAVDVAMKFYSLDESNVSSNLQAALSDKTLVLEFPENGELPGTTLIRIKDTDVFNKLESEKYYIYYVDEENDKLNKVALELQKSYDGYIEFYITHNSKYIISVKEVSDDSVLGEDEAVLIDNTPIKQDGVLPDSNKVLLYTVIGISAFVIIVLLVIIINMKKSSATKVKEEKED